jgi:hypothetical protein
MVEKESWKKGGVTGMNPTVNGKKRPRTIQRKQKADLNSKSLNPANTAPLCNYARRSAAREGPNKS